MNDREEVPILELEKLRVISALGRGAKGVVFLVKEENGSQLLALKVVLRDLIDNKRVCYEQQILRDLNHPLLPRLRGILETEKIVAFAIDYCPGRDLHSLRKQQSENTFSIDYIRFYAAELVLALGYLHKQGIVYRDLKPENILIQENGHIMLVDFDLSTKLSPKSSKTSPLYYSEEKRSSLHKRRPSFLQKLFCHSGISPELVPLEEPDEFERTNSFVGTEEYVAPEIILGIGHSFAVDWWSLGIVLYEMLYGTTPFKGENRKDTFFKIITNLPNLDGEATALRDLIGKLLVKDQRERIRLEEIKGHDFFRGIQWDLTVDISRPPYIPIVEINEKLEGIEDVEMFVRGVFDAHQKRNHIVNDNLENEQHTEVCGTKSFTCESNNFVVF